MIELGIAPTLVEPVILGDEAAGLAALTLAAVRCVTADDPVLLALPRERAAEDPAAFAGGVALAHQGYFVAFALAPGAPTARCRYYRAGPSVHSASCVAASFIEAIEDAPRPDADVYLRSAGIYAVRASVWIDIVGSSRKALLSACERSDIRGRIPDDAIDYAVMQSIAEGVAGPEVVAVRLDRPPQ